jgi:hypothetical protein
MLKNDDLEVLSLAEVHAEIGCAMGLQNFKNVPFPRFEGNKIQIKIKYKVYRFGLK